MKIIRTQYRSSTLFGKPCKTIAGHMKYDGKLQLLVDEMPKLASMEFKRYPPFLFAEQEGFVRIYEHKPGTKDGFAGREIQLNVEGELILFKGDLWDPMGFSDVSHVPEYRAVSITTESEVMAHGFTFYAGYVVKQLYDKLMEYAPPVIVKGNIMAEPGVPER